MSKLPSNVIKVDERNGHVTFQNRYYIGGVLFKINSQHCFTRIVWLEIGCGCGGTKKQHVKHYEIPCNGNVFYIDQKFVVETNTPIPEDAQDFDVARREQHRNPGDDFTDIVGRPNPAEIWRIANEVQPKDRFRH
jgi:hypothetical protein